MSDTQASIDPSEMTPAQAHAEAVRRIEAAAQSGQYWLDLGDLPLEVVPAEIAVLAGQLTELSLGRYQVEELRKKTGRKNWPWWHGDWADRNIPGRLLDLSALKGLSNLRSLDLSGCASVNDFSPIGDITSLYFLNLNWCGLKDIALLQPLTELRSLQLWSNRKIKSFRVLHNLLRLENLNLCKCDMATAGLAPIKELTSLHSLVLRQSGISEISSLQELTSLRTLDISFCSGIVDFSPLKRLNELRSINMERARIINISPLEGLTKLQSLNLNYCENLNEISPLQYLNGLERLNLGGCNQLTEITSLKGLTTLKQLDLSNCRRIAELTPVLKLSKLEYLNIIHSGGLNKLCPAELVKNLLQIRTLLCNQLSYTPTELISTNGVTSNFLPRLRAWLADLEQGEAESHDLKLFFLGNGRVGKSELFRRLRGEDFHGELETTHSIQLDRFELGMHSDGKQIFCNAWDFGGQDIYLGTHALFLKSRALFVLAWHPEMETDAPYTEAVSGLEMRHRPLRYWLDYIHALAGEEARVIVVQTQCATEHDEITPDLGDTKRFAWIKATASCSAQEDGVKMLQVLLKKAAAHRLEKPLPPRMPASWLAVRDRLFELRATEKTIDRDRFDTICAETHRGASADALLHYLHQAGDVFHQSDVFGGAIVLDQQWALDGIYAIFQREKVLKMLLRHHGRVHADDFDVAVWHERFSPREQTLLLSMMERCDLIFRLYGRGSETQYAMVDALPAADSQTAALPEHWRPGPRYRAMLHYDFLHEGILRAWIAGIGREANAKAHYWRYGTAFYDTHTKCDAWMQATINHDGSGHIALITQGEDAQWLRESLIERFAQIRIGKAPTVERHDPPGSAPAVAPRRDEEASNQIVVGARPHRPGDKPEVYISYARGGEDRPELRQFGEDLHIALQECFTVHRDERSLKPGDSIEEFMERIGCGARVLVVMSRHYLMSRYCMQESERLHSRHGGRRDKMQKCILPLVIDPALQLDDGDIMATADHWRGKVAELDAWLTGKAQDAHLIMRQRLGRYRKIAGVTDDMLDFLSDTVMPRDEAELRANDFAVVKDALRRLPGADAPP